MRLTVSVSALRVGDYLPTSRQTIKRLGPCVDDKRTVETSRPSGYVSTRVWNTNTRILVERLGESSHAEHICDGEAGQ